MNCGYSVFLGPVSSLSVLFCSETVPSISVKEYSLHFNLLFTPNSSLVTHVVNSDFVIRSAEMASPPSLNLCSCQKLFLFLHSCPSPTPDLLDQSCTCGLQAQALEFLLGLILFEGYVGPEEKAQHCSLHKLEQTTKREWSLRERSSACNEASCDCLQTTESDNLAVESSTNF